MTDTDRNTAMAEALGWERHGLKIQDTNYWVAPTGFPTADYCMTTDMLAAYFASPAGEKAVRDKVREECDRLGYDLRYGYLTMCAGNRQHFVLTGPPDKHTITYSIIANKGSNNYADTEAAAYAAALIWLAERGD